MSDHSRKVQTEKYKLFFSKILKQICKLIFKQKNVKSSKSTNREKDNKYSPIQNLQASRPKTAIEILGHEENNRKLLTFKEKTM